VDPRGFPTSLPEFQRVFPDDAACAAYLEALRWPGGFSCSRCGVIGEPFRISTRPSSLRCRSCRAETSLTAGTVMQRTHMPLSVWFWAAYLISTETPGHSALQFQRQLALSRYETAYQVLHKLRAGMVRPERDPIGGEHAVEVDETLVGGRTRGEGRGKHHKIHVIGVVEARRRKDGEDRSAQGARDDHRDGRPLKRDVYAGRLRLQVVSDRKAATCERFVRDNVLAGSTVRTDGWQGYDGLKAAGYAHHGLAMNADHELTDAHLPLVHLVFSNFKAWLLGIHHGVSQQHLQAYCNEFVFRFNRRFYPATTFNSLLGLAAKTVPPTYESLYSGEWEHPLPHPRAPQVELPFA
jgi:transposase-like protein